MACNLVEIDDCVYGTQKVGNTCIPCGGAGGNTTAANPANNLPFWQVLIGALPGLATGASDVIDSIKNNPGGGNGQPIVIQNQPPAQQSNTILIGVMVFMFLLVLAILAFVLMRNKGSKPKA